MMPHTPSPTPTTLPPLYQPTPMEEAFGLYLLETAFPASHAQFLSTGRIHIPGQDAVAFLTTSGIHRLILRNVWTVADPHNDGTLHEMHQLQVILRLVALAQNGQVEHELLAIGAAVSATGIPLTPTQVLRDILRKTQPYTACPLPTFAKVAPPTTEHLQSIYQQYQQQQRNRNSELRMQPPQPQQQQPQEPVAVAPELPNPTGGMSVSDAFGDLVPAADAPLPALVAPQSERALGYTGTDVAPSIQTSWSFPGTGGGLVPSVSAAGDDDDFGGFTSPTPLAASSNSGFSTATPTTATTDGAFGGFSTATANSHDDDDFGGFAAASVMPHPQSDRGLLSASAAEFSTAVPPIAASHSFPLPSTTTASGGGMDAFGALAPGTMEEPLPSLNAPGMTVTNTADEGFGGFADASMPPPQSDRSFFSASSQLSPPTSIPASQSFPLPPTNFAGMDAFDALGGAHDAPLPQWSQFGTAAPVTSQTSTGTFYSSQDNVASGNDNKSNDDDFDDMGDFVDANNGTYENNPAASTEDVVASLSLSAGHGHTRHHSMPTDVNEAAPKDLMPHLPGEKYVQHHRRSHTTPGGLMNICEPSTGEVDNEDDQTEQDDPFAGLDPAPMSSPGMPRPSLTMMGVTSVSSGSARDLNALHLNPQIMPSLSTASSVEDIMPQDLTPHAQGEHYVHHGHSPEATPGGLTTVVSSENEDDDAEDDDFGDFEGVEKDKTNEDSFGNFEDAAHYPSFVQRTADVMPHDLLPHPPGAHYVPRHLNAVGGLGTVGEEQESGPSDPPHVDHLNPPTTLGRQSTPLPQDLKPHAPGQHYVPHSHEADSTPGGLATVGEAFEDFGIMEDAPLPSLGSFGTKHKHVGSKRLSLIDDGADEESKDDDEEEDDFGDFAELTIPATPGGLADLSTPTQLSRQATPAPQDLQQTTRSMTVPSTATIHEDEDAFGGFEDAFGGSTELPSPSGLTRQVTPAPQDLQASNFKVASAGALGGAVIAEGDEDEVDDDFGGFEEAAFSGDFEQVGMPGQMDFLAPPQMMRQETPRPQDIMPKLPGQSMAAPSQGLACIGESLEEVGPAGSTPAGDGSDSISEEEIDPFAAFDALAEPQPMVGPLSSYNAGADGSQEMFSTPIPALTGLTRQVTPAPQDIQASDFKGASAGAFGGVAINEGDEDEDDFGGFEGPNSEMSSMATPAPTGLTRQVTPAPQDLQASDFKAASAGAFGGVAIAEEEEDEDDFHGFEANSPAIPCTTMPAPTGLTRQVTPAPQDLQSSEFKAASAGSFGGLAIAEGDEEDNDFGGFEEAGQEKRLTLIDDAQEDKFGPDEGGFGDFAGFAAADSDITAMPPPIGLARQVTPAPQDLQRIELKPASAASAMGGMAIQEGEEGDEDDFGDFGTFEQADGAFDAPAPPANAGDFGDFVSFFAASSQNTTGGNAAFAIVPDDFGDFAAFSSEPVPVPSREPPGANVGAWDAFQESPATQYVGTDESSGLRQQIVSLSRNLPDAYRSNIDYGNLFDVNIGIGFSLDASKKKRAQRCVQLLTLLSSSRAQLASTYWMQVLAVARDELTRGRDILRQASGLSSQEKQVTQQSLQVMVAGLGEFIRATRSIAASAGDMLLLDLNAPFTTAALASSWGSIPLVKSAMELESLWEEVLHLSSNIGLIRLTTLETVEEIRKNCLERCPCDILCQLTLQPLSDTDSLTKTKVAWGGKTFMACSANFLANKCPFYVIGE